MTKEIWKDIPEHPGYQASSFGGLRSLDRWVHVNRDGGYDAFYHGKSLTPKADKRGYLYTKLGSGRMYIVHRLIAITFIANPLSLPEVNHKDGKKGNNKVENLEWCTAKQNKRHAYDTGLKSGYPNEDHPMCRFSDAYVRELRAMDFSKRGAMRQFAIANKMSPAHLGDIIAGRARKGA